MAYIDEIKNCLKKLIACESVETAPEPGMPFGAGVNAALELMLAEGKRLGFEARGYDGYAGEIIFGGGAESMAVLCHLDVVPAGEGWSVPPFCLTEKDGRLYGRGIVDDKGPAAVCLYAMKRLKDEGFVPKHTVKLILGCDEESGWKCMEHYKKCAEMPEFGFSPDADFPVIYAEKGILHVKLYFAKSERLVSLCGGERVNMVPAKAVFKDSAPNLAAARELGLDCEGGAFYSYGVQAHGSTPELGKNALEPVFKYICGENLADSDAYALLFEDGFGLKGFKDETGALTFSPNAACVEDGRVAVCVDIRYPASMREEQVLDKIKAKAVDFEILSSQPPLYNEKDCFLIEKLLKVYSDFTGRPQECVAIGGGTYARALKIGAAFGPEKPGELSTVHQADENMSEENLKDIFEIYYRAIKSLAGD